MLHTLRIKNLAVIEKAEIPFEPGLNILSGETGAGKSIIIEALSLILGGRTNVDLIRFGCEDASVEGIFEIDALPRFQKRLEELGIVDDGKTEKELLIKRTFSRAGKNKIYVNDSLVTLSTLQKLCEGLVDLCGQHEHQSLLKGSTQLELLDRFGGLSDIAQKTRQLFLEAASTRKTLTELLENESDREKKLDYIRFQIEELDKASLKENEEESLQEERKLLTSSNARIQLARSIETLLDSDEGGIHENLRLSFSKAEQLAKLDPSSVEISAFLGRALTEIEELSHVLSQYSSTIETDEGRLEQVMERLSLLSDLRRKYGASAGEMLARLESLRSEMDDLQNIDVRSGELSQKLSTLLTSLKSQGLAISQERKKAAKEFSDLTTKELKDLKMEESRFTVDVEFDENVEAWTSWGGDQVSYLVQTNKGEEAKPIGRIASGGELSRIMLAVRRVISDKGGIGVYLFDEIDAGIGGQTAFQVGKKLKSVASHNQVICITHVPQVASFADHHLSVQKETVGTRTNTAILVLDRKEQKEEIARMLGGPVLTKKSLENAAELLQLAR